MLKILAVTAESDLPESHTLCGLAATGHTVRVICSPKSPFLERFKKAIPTEELSFRSRFDFKAMLRLRRIIRDFRPDIIHSFTARALTTALFASLGTAARHVAYRGTCGHLSRIDPSSWFSFLNPRIDRIVCVSNAVREYMQLVGMPDKKLAVIYKGHELSWYQAAPRETLKQFNIPTDAFVVGFTGNMRPVKGADLLIEAAEKIPANVHLLMIGEVRDERVTRLAQVSSRKDSIHFTGFRKDASSLIGACDCFVMPSREREGLPKAVLEAMALGVPPIVSRAGGMPEMVEDGTSGIIVDANDSDGLAKAIRALANDRDLRIRMGQNAREQITGKFALQETIRKTDAVYRDLVK